MLREAHGYIAILMLVVVIGHLLGVGAGNRFAQGEIWRVRW